MLRCQVMILSQVLGAAAEFEQVSIERGHLGLNVIEKECLDQVRPVDLERNLFEEVVNGKAIVADDILNEFVFDRHVRVKVESSNSALGESKTLEWVQAVV